MAARTRGARVVLGEAVRGQGSRHGAARREGAEAMVAGTMGERAGLREAGRRRGRPAAGWH
eukprot:2296309-Pleurochrysis_carterae.AAC.1